MSKVAIILFIMCIATAVLADTLDISYNSTTEQIQIDPTFETTSTTDFDFFGLKSINGSQSVKSTQNIIISNISYSTTYSFFIIISTIIGTIYFFVI